jgi:hypothetical protein
MITNFETITAELTDEELSIIPILVSGFNNRTKENPIKEPKLVQEMNQYLIEKGYQIKMTGVRLRKMVNYIRTNSIIPLIATSNGYFVSYDNEEIQKQINSLTQRCNSIYRCAEGLKTFINLKQSK